MQITTNATIIAGLNSLYGLMTQNSAADMAGTSGSAATGFGPAALLSLGQETSTEPGSISFDYTHLARLAIQTSPPTQQLSPEQQKAEEETIKQATVLRLGGYYDEARGLLNDLLAKNPANGIAVHSLGAIELDQGKYEKAEQLFRKAHYLAPEQGFDSDAQNARILQRDDEDVFEHARRLVRQDDTRDEGIRLLVSLTRRSPSNAEARILLAESLIQDGDAANGLSQYQLAISTASHSQLKHIASRLESLVDVAPKAAYLRNLLGQTQLQLGEYEQAAETLALATQLSDYDPLYLSDEALAHVGLGRNALKRGEITAAMSSFRTAKNLDPFAAEVKRGLAEGYTTRGEWRLRIGDPSTAIDDFRSAEFQLGSVEDEDLRLRSAAGIYRAGLILEDRRLSSGDDVGKEIVAFQTAYDLDPDNLTYRRKLAETRNTIGDEYWADEEYKDAALAYRRAYELESRNQTYKANTVNAFVAYGDERAYMLDYTGAIEGYRAAYEIDTSDAAVKLKLAEAYNARGLEYKSQGRLDLAFLDFREALHLFPDNEEYQANYDSVNPDG